MRKIYNLNDDWVSSYDSGESAEHDLTTEYMLNNNLASQIHNEIERNKVSLMIRRIGKDGRTLTLGDFCCKD